MQKLKDKYLQLQESEARYRRLVEAAPDISYIFGTVTGAKYWSPQVKDILGISPDTLIKDPFAWIKAIHPEDLPRVQDLFNSLKDKKRFSIEYRIKDKKGNWRWLNDRTVSVKKTKCEYLIEGLAQDITEQKEMEKELRTSEEKFRKAFMTSTDSININRLDDGLYISINPGFTRIMGYSENDVIGKTSLELNIWKDTSDREKLVNGLREHGHYSNLEAEFIAKNGSIKRGLMSASIIYLNNIPHILNITRDITDRTIIDQALSKNQYFLEKSQEIGNIGTWEIDLSTETIYWTQQSYKIFEIEPSTPIDFKYFINLIHPDDRETVLSKWNKALQGEPYDIEHRIIVNDKIKWVREKAHVDFESSGRNTVLGTVQDITSRKDIEEALKESEEKYRLIVENASDGFEITQDNHIIYSNEKFAEMLGYTTGELSNILFENIFSADAKKDLLKRQEKRQKGETLPPTYETTFIKKDGSEITVEVTYQIIEFQNKPATFAIIRDISKSRQMEKDLIKLSTAVQQSPSIIVITDTDGKIEYVNPRFSQITGYRSEEVIGQTPRILKSEYLPEDTYSDLWNTIHSGNTWRGEFNNIKKNGDMYWENAAISPIYDHLGHIIHYLKVAEDITESKNIEEALRLSEEKYRLIVENANDGIIISQNEKFIYSNAQFAAMLGYTIPELDLISFRDIYTKEALSSLYQRQDKRQHGEFVPEHYETTFKKKNGDVIIVDINYQIIDYHDNPATFAIVRNITQQKKDEKNLKTALERAEESDRLKSAFLANMSHEIRTPMNGIIGFTKLLKNIGLSEDKREKYIDIIEKSSYRMLNIINDLIDISKIEAGQMEVKFEYININDMIDFLYQFFKPECDDKGIYIHKHCDLEKAVIHTDKDKLEAVLINLMKNAIKFTNHGGITFGYKRNTETLSFYVEDTGIGIPKDKQEAIFKRFVQVDSSISKPYEGAGLGLSISQAFVDMLGGQLCLQSTYNEGSMFYFELPYNAEMHYEETLPEEHNESVISNTIDNLNILIAEDDEPSFLFLNILLQPFAAKICHARNGSEAIEMFRKDPDIDLILMDVKMPGMDGYQATKTIREFNKDVLIIAQTAYAFSDDHEKMMASGCNGYITKPIHEDDLSQMINKYFKK